jgi:OOP family OmpA-OmpF porin
LLPPSISHEYGIAGALPARDDGGVTRTTKLLAAALLALSGLVAASQASAQGFYIGASAGKSDIEDDIAIPGLITSGTAGGKDSGFKIFGGYQFNQYFGLDLAYVDLGKATYSGSYYGASVTGGTVKVWGLNLSVVGTYPLNSSFAVFGKLGVFGWEAKWSDTTGGVPFSSTENGADLSLGVGVSYNFTKNFSARFEWERFKVGGGEDYYTGWSNLTGSANIDFVSLGVVYKF